MTTQDFTKGIDITAQETVTGSQMNQLVDVARTASDKGLIIETTDTAIETPEVPNPAQDYDGITPNWWTRYIWRRKTLNIGVIHYYWDDDAVEDPIYLKWTNFIDATWEETAETAMSIATEALTIATGANSLAELASDKADTNETNIATNTTSIAGLNTSVSELEELLESLIWKAGDFKWTASAQTYSTAEDEGWLVCDGSLVSRTVFASLFSAIGTRYGEGDGSTTFQLPDTRGRTLVSDGQGTGLTNRQLTTGYSFGLEGYNLTVANLPDHTHDKHATSDNGFIVGKSTGTGTYFVDTGAGNTYDWSTVTGGITGFGSVTPVSSLQPSFVARLLIKT